MNTPQCLGKKNTNISSIFKQLKKEILNIYHLKCFFVIDTNDIKFLCSIYMWLCEGMTTKSYLNKQLNITNCMT